MSFSVALNTSTSYSSVTTKSFTSDYQSGKLHLIVIYYKCPVANGTPAITSLTSGYAGCTLARYSQNSFTQNGVNCGVEVWWGVSSGNSTASGFTVNFDRTVDTGAMVLIATGLYSNTAPFDPGSFPLFIAPPASGTASSTYSTAESSSYLVLLEFNCSAGTDVSAQSSPWTSLAHLYFGGATPYFMSRLNGRELTTAASGVNVSATGAQNGLLMVALAGSSPTVTATGSMVFKAASLAGVGEQNIPGTAALAFRNIGLSGDAAQIDPAYGNPVFPRPQLGGSGPGSAIVSYGGLVLHNGKTAGTGFPGAASGNPQFTSYWSYSP